MLASRRRAPSGCPSRASVNPREPSGAARSAVIEQNKKQTCHGRTVFATHVARAAVPVVRSADRPTARVTGNGEIAHVTNERRDVAGKFSAEFDECFSRQLAGQSRSASAPPSLCARRGTEGGVLPKELAISRSGSAGKRGRPRPTSEGADGSAASPVATVPRFHPRILEARRCPGDPVTVSRCPLNFRSDRFHSVRGHWRASVIAAAAAAALCARRVVVAWTYSRQTENLW